MKRFLKNNLSFCLMLLMLFAARSSLADWYHVPSGSMEPNIVVGDRVWVDKTAYDLQLPFTNVRIARFATPEAGDIVVFESNASGERMIKRVIGTPGDTVALANRTLWHNGEAITKGDIDELNGHRFTINKDPALGQGPEFNSVTVPEGHYLVMGDNRPNSADSRFYGLVPMVEIQGKATHRVVSLNPENYYLPRKDLGFFTPLP